MVTMTDNVVNPR